ncbi:hypothetical protein PanWU01x14_357570, partial [Parasponia andersonii]
DPNLSTSSKTQPWRSRTPASSSTGPKSGSSYPTRRTHSGYPLACFSTSQRCQSPSSSPARRVPDPRGYYGTVSNKNPALETPRTSPGWVRSAGSGPARDTVAWASLRVNRGSARLGC